MSRVLPILFNTDMVRAVLDGRKTVTRRVVKQQQFMGLLPDKCKNGTPEEFLKEKKYMFKPYCDMTDVELIKTSYNPPYHTDDVLYVRETWAPIHPDKESNEVCGYIYKEDSLEEYDKRYPDGEDYQWGGKWHPSIHMPKKAARIWLKVKDVRTERLQEITEEQAKAEGAKQCYEQINTIENRPVTYIAEDGNGYYSLGFKSIWNSTIKKSDLDRYGWDASPWVWVIEFERCEKPEGWCV